MTAWQNFRDANKRFFKHWASYVLLFFLTSAVVALLAVSTFNWFTSWLLRVTKIPYISFNNIGEILTGHIVVALILIVELIVILIVIYWQFAFILLSVRNIQHGKSETLMQVLRQTVASLKVASPLTFVFFLGYFIIILPFGSLFLRTPLLNKVKIPGFLMDFFLQNPLYTAGLVLFYLVIGYIGIRLFLTLPFMILSHTSAKTAIKLSWQKTRGRLWFYLASFLLIAGVSSIVTSVVYALIYGAQTYLDTTRVAFASAMLNLFIMEFVAELMSCYVPAMAAGLMLDGSEDFAVPVETAKIQFGNRKKGHRRILRLLTATMLVFTAASLVIYNVAVLKGLALSRPMAISHRGVDNGNGVQNTLPALRLTSQEHPDYVEMDIHETKDHQFVVMHDENLKDLAGINKAPYQLTLQQLTKITVRENGHHAKIASFDDYLKTAHQLHQKLLVEIKVTPHDSANMTQLFVKRYEQSLLKHHDRVHTLSYPVVTQLKQQAPKLFVSFILPYNLTFPETKANAYTMEATTLNSSFISNADERHQQVYAWTVNDVNQMDEMMFLGTNAIITDQLHSLQTEIKQNTDHPSYANLLLALMNEFEASEDSKTV